MSATNKTGGFSEAEKQAMRERAAELKAEKGGKKKAEMEKAPWTRSPPCPTRTG